jgi:hypothetical protein
MNNKPSAMTLATAAVIVAVILIVAGIAISLRA